MKKIMQITILVAALLFIKIGDAQVSVNVNIGVQPLWGPVGYDYVDYYYMPQYDVYYHVPAHRFVYLNKGKWIFAAALPSYLGPVDFYSTYKVVVNQPKAYLYHDDHKVKYVKYKSGGFDQVVIKNSKEPKYYVVKGHPSHAASGQAKKSTEVKHQGGHPQKVNGPAPSHGGQGGGKGKGKGH